jgi:hypothetical protein
MVLTMLYSTQSYWASGLFSSSGVLGNRNTTFRKLDLLPSSGEAGEDTYSPIMKLLIMQFSPTSYHFISLLSKYSQYPQSMFLP